MTVKKTAILILMFFALLGQIPGFVRAMKNRQTARSWFMGFVIALLTGCWLLCFLHAEL